MTQSSASSELVRAYANRGAALSRIVRASLPSRQLGRRVALLAKERGSVLVVGETGTGKTLVANELQAGSEPSARNLSVNCASLSDAQLAQQVLDYLPPTPGQENYGALFLDEVGELSPWGQAVLLRALSDRDPTRAPRLIATTYRDLEAMVRAGSFSGELLLRLRGETLHLPPLRERITELSPLALHFVRIALIGARPPVISIEPELIAQLERHRWPGNVRELQNVLTRAVAECVDGVLRVELLPEKLRRAAPMQDGSA
ncbi:MAG TPA: sigma 54-interacting transcriptional regulator [Polyangiales bacterium]